MTDDLTQAIRQLETRLTVAQSTPPERTLWTLEHVLTYLDVLELARMVGHRDPRSLMIYYNETAEELAKKLG